MSDVLIKVNRLQKVFRLGLMRRRVDAVKDVSLEVRQGEIFGFLGPNGAGKTTTIKMITGLISPTSGDATIFGDPIPSVRAMARVGFMPENPYVYPFLTPREFVEMCAQLSGLSRKDARAQATKVLGQTGVLYAADRPVRRLSKGMLQRTGLASALVADPELLILDEPMSGLDPVGRKEVRELILAERAAGRTIFFSSHILGDVETLCDRVTILRKGEVVVTGKLSELLNRDVRHTNVVLADVGEALESQLAAMNHELRRVPGRLVVTVDGGADVQAVVRAALDESAQIIEVAPVHETLEDLFVREAIESGEAPPAEQSASR
ncbi:MAG: ABC transporter ATP-binding protein [Polyangiaceae bacterium]|nr:ABC transporter ATP-binding protein [Polyangiaceae bacterium]